MNKAQSYIAGDKLDLDLDVGEGESAELTMALFARSNCGACINAKPVLSRIVRRAGSIGGVRVILFVPFGSSLAAERRFAADIGLPPRSVIQVESAESVRVGVVPAILLIGPDSRVVFIVEGLGLGPNEIEAAVIRRLEAFEVHRLARAG